MPPTMRLTLGPRNVHSRMWLPLRRQSRAAKDATARHANQDAADLWHLHHGCRQLIVRHCRMWLPFRRQSRAFMQRLDHVRPRMLLLAMPPRMRLTLVQIYLYIAYMIHFCEVELIHFCEVELYMYEYTCRICTWGCIYLHICMLSLHGMYIYSMVCIYIHIRTQRSHVCVYIYSYAHRIYINI